MKLFVEMQLQQALEGRHELQLKQALLTANQCGQTGGPLVVAATKALEKLTEDRRVEGLVSHLGDAMSRKDIPMLYALIRAGRKDPLFGAKAEFAEGEVLLRQLVAQEL